MAGRRRPEAMASLADCSGVMEAEASRDGRPWRLQCRAKPVQQARELARDGIGGGWRRVHGGRRKQLWRLEASMFGNGNRNSNEQTACARRGKPAATAAASQRLRGCW